MPEPLKHCIEGMIVSGEKAGNRVQVEDDSLNSGGYLIIFWDPVDPNLGGDYWIQSFDDIAKGFEELQWEIKWDEPFDSLRH